MGRRLLVLLTVVAAVAVSIALVGRHSGHPSHQAATPQPTTPRGPTRTRPAQTSGGPRTVAGASMGHAHDPVGALAAAVAYAQFAEAAVGNSVDDVVAAQEAMASDASRAALVASTRQKLEALYAVYPPDSLSYRVAVVAAKVTIVDPDSCRIDLWQVTVLGVVNGPTREDWSTLTYGLVWERGDWRVASEVTAPGPYPAPWPQVTPTLPDELAARLAGFGPIGADR